MRLSRSSHWWDRVQNDTSVLLLSSTIQPHPTAIHSRVPQELRAALAFVFLNNLTFYQFGLVFASASTVGQVDARLSGLSNTLARLACRSAISSLLGPI